MKVYDWLENNGDLFTSIYGVLPDEMKENLNLTPEMLESFFILQYGERFVLSKFILEPTRNKERLILVCEGLLSKKWVELYELKNRVGLMGGDVTFRDLTTNDTNKRELSDNTNHYEGVFNEAPDDVEAKTKADKNSITGSDDKEIRTKETITKLTNNQIENLQLVKNYVINSICSDLSYYLTNGIY